MKEEKIMKIKKYIGIVKNYHDCMSGCRIELLSKFYDDYATFQQWFHLYPESEHIILENTEELYNMFSIFEDRRHPITEEEKQNIEEGKKLYKKLMGDK